MDEILKIGLIDDEHSALKVLEDIIAQYTNFELGFATTDPIVGLEKLERRDADIVILDVMIPKMGGLEISERLSESGIPIILCSAYDKYAVSGYQHDAVYFVSKPATYKEVTIGLKKARERLGKSETARNTKIGDFRIINSTGGVTGEVIQVDDIDYLEQTGNYTNIFIGKTKRVIVSSLSKSILKLGSEYIIQVHKSFAINIRKIKLIQYSQIILYNGNTIPVGKVYRRKIDHLFGSKML